MYILCVLHGACVIEVDMMFSELWMLQRLRKLVGQEQLCLHSCVRQTTTDLI